MKVLLHKKTPPGAPPVSLDEVKLHLRIDNDQTDEDGYLMAAINAATLQAETFCNRGFITQVWVASLADWPEDEQVTIPFGPVQTVDEVTYIDQNEDEQTLSASAYQAIVAPEPAIVSFFVDNSATPTLGSKAVYPVQIEFTVGYGATHESVPEDLKFAIKRIVGGLYSCREEESPLTMKPLVRATEIMLAPYRLWGFP